MVSTHRAGHWLDIETYIAGGLHWLRPLRMLVGEVSQVVASCNKTIPHMKGPGLTQVSQHMPTCVNSVIVATVNSHNAATSDRDAAGAAQIRKWREWCV